MGGLISSENKDVCIKILKAFAEIFKYGPAVAFTDEDGAWMAAFVYVIATVPAYSKTAHFLCTWHMSNHIRGHCMKLFGKTSVEWQQFIGYWWKLVNDSDMGRPDPETLFRAAFQSWYDMLLPLRSDSDLFKEAERHVVKTWTLRHKWAGLNHNAHSFVVLEFSYNLLSHRSIYMWSQKIWCSFHTKG